MFNSPSYWGWTCQGFWKKTLIVGFCCVNTKLPFDSQILLSNKKNEKIIFDLEINGQRQIKRISTKILKIDGNKQYGQAMAKPLPYDCIKKNEKCIKS